MESGTTAWHAALLCHCAGQLMSIPRVAEQGVVSSILLIGPPVRLAAMKPSGAEASQASSQASHSLTALNRAACSGALRGACLGFLPAWSCAVAMQCSHTAGPCTTTLPSTPAHALLQKTPPCCQCPAVASAACTDIGAGFMRLLYNVKPFLPFRPPLKMPSCPGHDHWAKLETE
jgi:hypothetical protein